MYLRDFLAAVSFETFSVLDHSFFLNDIFSRKISKQAAVDKKKQVLNMLFTSSLLPPPQPLSYLTFPIILSLS